MNPGAVLAITLFSLMISFGLTAATLAGRGFWPNLAEELVGRGVEIVTSGSVSPFIAPYIEKEVEYVQTA